MQGQIAVQSISCISVQSPSDFNRTPHLNMRSTSTATATTQTHSQEPKEVKCSRETVHWERSMFYRCRLWNTSPLSRPLDLFCFDFCNSWWPKWQITLQWNLEVLNHVPTIRLSLDLKTSMGRTASCLKPDCLGLKYELQSFAVRKTQVQPQALLLQLLRSWPWLQFLFLKTIQLKWNQIKTYRGHVSIHV